MAITARPARAWVSGVAGCLALLGSAMGAFPAGVSAASRTPSAAAPAGRLSVPTPGPAGLLQGVSCTSSANCWAVGNYGNRNGAIVSQALHWDGRKWSSVSAPSPGGTASGNLSTLNGVACASPRSCWAVGYFNKPGRPDLNLVLHWNGSRWSLVSVPDPGGTTGTGGSVLRGVRCVSAGSCWAVGGYDTATGAPTLNQVLYWNGRTWSQAAAPSPGGTATGGRSVLTDVRCPSPDSCWAVGDYAKPAGPMLNQVLHWNGRKWQQAAAPSPGGTASASFSGLNGVACPSPVSCWAVGGYGTTGSAGTAQNQVLHWNGRRWFPVRTPNPDGTGAGASNRLSDVACTSAASCWAVGSYGTPSSTGVALNQALHWDGTKWSPVPTPNPAGTASGDDNFLNGIRCTSSASCWAVGFRKTNGAAFLNQALHWNGTTWSIG